MKNLFPMLLACVLCSLFVSTPDARAQGTAFTYQGRLDSGGSPVNGANDLTFTLYNAATLGATVGTSNVFNDLLISNGLFTVTLDFGAGAFNGSARWLQIAARPGASTGAYTNLAPRQPVTPTPYAITAANAGTAAAVSGSVPVAQLTGTIPVAQLPASVVTNGASGLNLSGTLSGTFSGNGAGLTGVDLRTVNGQGALSFTTNNGVFVLASSPAVGNSPRSVTSADVNGDGKADLISANINVNTLTVLTNNGSGGLVLASSPSVGSAPHSVTSADVNGDGKADLISANLNANTLTVLTNTGSGGFVLSSSPGVGSGPISVTSADVNGDGKADLISANINVNTLTVLTNNGSGGFVLSSSPGVAGGPQSVTSADVNGDGKADLISANSGANTLRVLTNNGSGGFVLASSPAVGDGSISVTSADVNGDGKADLISANFNTSTLTVLTNNGTGGFVLASSPGVGSGPHSVTSADVNGDGQADLISANVNASTLTVLTNNGSGGFVLASSPAVGVGPISVTSADVNGDGKADLISANINANTLTVLFNTTTIPASFAGDGSGLTSLNAASLTGTVADARLSANVALRAGGNNFTGDQTVMSGNVGIGKTDPGAKLDVNGNIAAVGGITVNYAGASSINFNDTVNDAGKSWFLFNNYYGAGNFAIARFDPALGGFPSDKNIFINAAGNVGIGTTSPGALLSLGTSLPAGVKLALYDALGDTYGLGMVGGAMTFHTGNTEKMRLTANGRLGIGMTQPGVPLEVGPGPSFLNVNGYFYTAGGVVATFPGHIPVVISIKATDAIAAQEFIATSDQRIKNVIRQSDRAADLQTLLGIKVTDYTYKDTVAKGNRPQKKVIAQQVEAVYPQAVSHSTGVVPDIYQKATQKDGWVQLATDLKVGERVKLIGEKEEGIHEVLEVRKDAFRTAFKPATEKVFIYGREVKDFRNVDYEAISMLNVSATQELARKAQAQEAKLTAQEEELAALRAELSKLRGERTSMAQTVNDMEARFVRLEQAMNNATVPAVKDVSASADVK